MTPDGSTDDPASTELQARIHALEAELTAVRAAEADARRRLDAVLAAAPVAVYETDRAGRYVYIAGSAMTDMGLKAEDFVGRRRAEAMGDSMVETADGVTMTHAAMIARVLQGETLRAVGRVRGARHELWTTPVTEPDGAVRGYLGVAFDRTPLDVSQSAQRALESQLRQAQKMEAVGHLAGGVAHDFNNILTVIVGYVQEALDHTPADWPARVALKEVHAAAGRAATLTRQLLAFSRRQVLHARPVDFNSLLTSMEKLLRRVIPANVVISTDLDPTLPAVLCDSAQIEQVVLNLAVNARDAMPAGGTLRLATGRAGTAGDDLRGLPGVSPDRHAVLTLTDTGMGMDEVTAGRIFEPFFTTKPVGHGTGLGLSTAYGIVRQSGGYITVESAPAKGATFRVYLPLTADTVPPPEPVAALPPPRGHETVLVVEDDPHIRTLVDTALRGQGYVTLTADGGAEALALAAAYPETIHLLLTDVVLPGPSGTDVARALTVARPGLRVLFMSGYPRGVPGGDTHALPRAGLLAKPFTLVSLAARVRAVLDEPWPEAPGPMDDTGPER